jgi:lysophospholipase L1-like esterase
MPKKIVILADSLSLPRPENLGNTPYEETYPYLMDISLREQMGINAPIIIEKGKRSRTMPDVAADWNEYVSWRKPEIVVIQVGITDCSPRVFTTRQRAYVERIPARFIREILLKFVRKFRRQLIAASAPKVYTTLQQYRDTVTKLVEWAERDCVLALVFVKIVMPPDSLEKRSPGSQENVRLYNNVLDQIKSKHGVYVIELNDLIHNQENAGSYIIEDGQHLSVQGHRLLAKHLEHLVMPMLFK